MPVERWTFEPADAPAVTVAKKRRPVARRKADLTPSREVGGTAPSGVLATTILPDLVDPRVSGLLSAHPECSIIEASVDADDRVLVERHFLTTAEGTCFGNRSAVPHN